jgi:RNA polymerase sigma factor (sigma-70 family)
MTADSSELPPVSRLLEDGAWLQALARSVIADQATADDVAQDAAVIALTKPPRESGALRGWLRRVVRNLATDAHRSAARREALEAACAKREADDDAADLAARWEIRRQVVDAVLALDEPYRATLLLRFFEGLDLAEVAARQRVPLDTVKTRQRRALDMLRARLAHLDDGAGRRGFAVLLVLARPGGGAAPITVAGSGGLAMSVLSKAVAVSLVVGLAAGVLLDRSLSSTPRPTSGADVVASASPAPNARPTVERPRTAALAGRADATSPAAVAPSAPAVAPNDDELRARVAKALGGLDGNSKRAYSVGKDLTKLDARIVLDVLRENWKTIQDVSDRQQLLKAFQQTPPHPDVLEVLDLGMTDSSPAVQNWAMLYLRNYAGRAFGDDWHSYAAWRERTSGKDPQIVVAATLRELVDRVHAATPDEMRSLGPLLDAAARTARREDLEATQAAETLAPWIARTPAKDLPPLLDVVAAARPGEDYLRRTVVPLLTDPDVEKRDAVFWFFTFDNGRDPWAVDVLTPMLCDTDPRTAAGAARALGGIGDARAIEPLIEALRGGASRELVDAAGQALSKITGVSYDSAHDAAWWDAWWTMNRARFQTPR